MQSMTGTHMSQLGRAAPKKENVVMGAVWMVGITLALFFLPLVNGILGGLVGGYKVGSVKRAMTAAVLPAIVAAAGLWGLLALFDMPVLGFAAGVATAVVVLLADIGLFIGAAIGGKMAER